MLKINCRNVFLKLVYGLYQNFIINVFITFFNINFIFVNDLTYTLGTEVSITLDKKCLLALGKNVGYPFGNLDFVALNKKILI